MRLGLLTASLVLTFSVAVRAQDAGDCFSPTQHADTAMSAQMDGGTGCPCDPAVDKNVCINKVAFFCENDRWITGVDGPCAFYQEDDREPASWCAMSNGRGAGWGGALTLLMAAAWGLRRGTSSVRLSSKSSKG